jgi:hypothetical protein
MPYKLVRSGRNYFVENKFSGRRYSKKSLPRERAVRQMRALYAAENGYSLHRARGGWASVPKSNPALWKKVLAEVKRESGPWAAWKAIKADRIYKDRGGRFLKN